MKILIINANTSDKLMAKVDRRAKDVASIGTEITTIKPQNGTASVEGFYDMAVASVGKNF